MESFVSHLAALLAVYDLGPQESIPIPTDLHTDTILNSLSTTVHGMWVAEEVLEKHNLKLDPAVADSLAQSSAEVTHVSSFF